MKIILVLVLILFGINTLVEAQQNYKHLILEADSFYRLKDYKSANEKYISALKIRKTDKSDLYNAACAAALSGDIKNAFRFLNLSIDNGWTDLKQLKNDSDLVLLHDSEQWSKVLNKMEIQLKRIEANYNQEAKSSLEHAYETDQGLRVTYLAAQKKDGYKSKKVDSLVRVMMHHDSLNTITVTRILDKYGWLGEDKVGYKGNLTLFLVIQHADLKTQQKYLPMLRAAVKKGSAKANALALLEDRVALGEGRKQVYGSQVSSVPNHPDKYYLSPLIDPENVDKRRASVGLQPIAEYIKRWNMTWDIEAYKKMLPQYEEWNKTGKN